MRCDEFENRLQEVLDRRGSPELEPELAEHLAGCAECRLTASALASAVARTAALPVPPCPDDMADRVLDALEPAVVPLRRMRWALVPLATAAGILVALPIGSWLARHREAVPTAQITAPPASGNRAVSMTDTSGVSMTDLAAAWLPLPVDENESQRGLATPAGEPWSREVSEGFEPVTRSTTGALESLWKAIPTSEDSRS